ncbi:MAG: glutathione S-transferase C-terminal domain-containing protein, partial [Gammaproteobacteria bacterium]
EHDFFPPEHQEAIESWNKKIYHSVNNGVYRAGFAAAQDAYEKAVVELFDTLESIENHLEEHSFLVGEKPTEADWRLFPTLTRFDVAYYGAFKCNIKRLIDFPNLWDYARRLYHQPGIADTVHFDVYKQGYYSQSEKRNPSGIVPAGPVIDWSLG